MFKLKIKYIVLIVVLLIFQNNLWALENEPKKILGHLEKTALQEKEIDLLNYLYLSNTIDKIEPEDLNNFLVEYGNDYKTRYLFQSLIYMLSADRNYFKMISGSDMRAFADLWKYNSSEFKSFISFRFYNGDFDKLLRNGKVLNYLYSLGYEYDDIEFAVIHASNLTLDNFEDTHERLMKRGYNRSQAIDFFTYHSKHDFDTEKLFQLFDLLNLNGFSENQALEFVINLFNRNKKLRSLNIDNYIIAYSEVLKSKILLNFSADNFDIENILRILYYFKLDSEDEIKILNNYIDFFGEEHGKSLFVSMIESSLITRSQDTSLIENLVEESKSLSKLLKISEKDSSIILSKSYLFNYKIDSRPILENQVNELIKVLGMDNAEKFMEVITRHLMRSSAPEKLLDTSISIFQNKVNINKDLSAIIYLLEDLDPYFVENSLKIALEFIESDYDNLVKNFTLEEIKKYFFTKNRTFSTEYLVGYHNLFTSIKDSKSFSIEEVKSIIELITNSIYFRPTDKSYLKQLEYINDLDIIKADRDKLLNLYINIYPKHSVESINKIVKIYGSTNLSFNEFLDKFFLTDIHANSKSNPSYWDILYNYSQYLDDFTSFNSKEKRDLLLEYSRADNSSISWYKSTITQFFKSTLSLSEKDRMKIILLNPMLDISKLSIDKLNRSEESELVKYMSTKYNLSKSKSAGLSKIINNNKFTVINKFDLARTEFSESTLTLKKSIVLTKASSITQSGFTRGLFVRPSYYQAFKKISKLDGSKLDKEFKSFNINLIQTLGKHDKVSNVDNYLVYISNYYGSKDYERNTLIKEVLYLLDINFTMDWNQSSIESTAAFITPYIDEDHLGILLELSAFDTEKINIHNTINYTGSTSNASRLLKLFSSFYEYNKNMRDFLYLYYAMITYENISIEETLNLLNIRTRVLDVNDDRFTDNIRQYYQIKRIQKDNEIAFKNAYNTFFQ